MAANRARRKRREHSRLSKAGWSDWEKAMVPTFRKDVEERGPGQDGFMCSSIKTAFPDQARHCGIYEWAAKRKLRGQPNKKVVVYIGSTCRGKPGALRGRILEYCRDGSHKHEYMNVALTRGYELWVRVKIVEGRNPSREKAQDKEDKLLARYDYAWNTRKNGHIRDILP